MRVCVCVSCDVMLCGVVFCFHGVAGTFAGNSAHVRACAVAVHGDLKLQHRQVLESFRCKHELRLCSILRARARGALTHGQILCARGEIAVRSLNMKGNPQKCCLKGSWHVKVWYSMKICR